MPEIVRDTGMLVLIQRPEKTMNRERALIGVNAAVDSFTARPRTDYEL